MCADQVGLLCLLKQSRLFPTSGPLHLQILLLGTLPGSFPLFRLQLSRHPGLISFRMDWLDLLAVQGTLKSLLQHCSSKASILQCAAFFYCPALTSYMTTGKNRALTIQIFVGKVISLLFNMPSRFVIAFFPRSKRLLISWLQSLTS